MEGPIDSDEIAEVVRPVQEYLRTLGNPRLYLCVCVDRFYLEHEVFKSDEDPPSEIVLPVAP